MRTTAPAGSGGPTARRVAWTGPTADAWSFCRRKAKARRFFSKPATPRSSCGKCGRSGPRARKRREAKESCLIQDEPGRESGFSYNMSLDERSRMLGQRALPTLKNQNTLCWKTNEVGDAPPSRWSAPELKIQSESSPQRRETLRPRLQAHCSMRKRCLIRFGSRGDLQMLTPLPARVYRYGLVPRCDSCYP